MKKRLAIINHQKCRPKKCDQQCGLVCPINRQKKQCVVVDIESVAASISEEFCIGCGQCVKACPFNAIQIINLPSEAIGNIVHKYGENMFQLHNMPIVRPNCIMGIIGCNGIGKSTLINILGGQIIPNLGEADKFTWNKGKGFSKKEHKKNIETMKSETLKFFRGKEIQKYFSKLYKKGLVIAHKPQQIKPYFEIFSNQIVSQFLKTYYQDSNLFHQSILQNLDLNSIMGYSIDKLSGGEKQRLLCAITLMQKADVYVFDEPSNFLDVKQRINISNLIQDLKNKEGEKYILVVEHDVTLLDYITDQICILYGKPGGYGIVSSPAGSSVAINNYFKGFIASDNIRIRNREIEYKINYEDVQQKNIKNLRTWQYPELQVEYPKTNFKLNVPNGTFQLGEPCLMVILGSNGTGKTTFLSNLASKLELSLSYKPQHLGFRKKYGNLTVRGFLEKTIGAEIENQLFKSDVVKPLQIMDLYQSKIESLSGGELQRVAITATLGKKANLYLLDEPSAGLDVEQRTQLLKVIERFVYHQNKTCFLVEHDALIATSLASKPISKVIVFEQLKSSKTSRLCQASSPMNFKQGMNLFLQQMKITFRMDHDGKRPKINKCGGGKDREQKKKGVFFDC